MGHGAVQDDVVIVQVCKNMGWTYAEYLDQPQWFVELATDMIRIESKEQERRIKHSKK